MSQNPDRDRITIPEPARTCLRAGFTDLDLALGEAERVKGALRAVGNLTRSWRTDDPEVLNAVARDDLACLFEVLMIQLDVELTTIRECVGALGTKLLLQA